MGWYRKKPKPERSIGEYHIRLYYNPDWYLPYKATAILPKPGSAEFPETFYALTAAKALDAAKEWAADQTESTRVYNAWREIPTEET